MRRRARGEGSIFRRRTGEWVAVLDLGAVGGRRIRRSFQSKTRQGAQAKLEEARQSLSLGHDATAVALGDYLERWLHDAARPNVRPSTLRGYRMIVREHLVPALGPVKLGRLTAPDVQRYLNDKLAGLSAQTVRHHHAVLRAALSQAVKWGILLRNPASLVTPPRVPKRSVQALTPARARQILQATAGERLSALYVLALSTGMRQGELLGLRWRDVDLRSGSLTVSNALQRIGGKDLLVEPKTPQSRRTIPLPEMALAALREHRKAQLEERLVPGYTDQDLVFAMRYGSPLYGVEVTKSFQKALERAGLPRMRFHDLRHGYASLALSEGVPLRTVMEVMGHSTITMTADLYGHLTAGAKRDAADRVDAALAR